jgi:hypothetical protein
MLKSVLFCCFLLLSLVGNVSAQNKVSWTFSYSNTTNEVVFQATIEEGWHLYSQVLKNDIGPIPTEFTFEENTSVDFIDGVKQPEPIAAFDANFGSTLDFFKDEVIFSQSVSVKNDTHIKGSVYYMVCDDQGCLPPIDVPFSIPVKK